MTHTWYPRVTLVLASVLVAGMAAPPVEASQPAVAQEHGAPELGEQIYGHDFDDGMAGWKAVTGSLDEWSQQPDHVVVDTQSPGHVETGQWVDSSLSSYNGSTTRYTNERGATATWPLPVDIAGEYEIAVWFPPHTTSTIRAEYTVLRDGGETTVEVDQRAAGGEWVVLGRFELSVDSGAAVRLTAVAAGWTRADAVRIALPNHVVTIDTREQVPGRYVTPTAALDLPDAYELRTTLRVEAVSSAPTVDVLTDWHEPLVVTERNLAAQLLLGGDSVRIGRPPSRQTVCTGLGSAPVPLGAWHDLVIRRANGISVVEVDGQPVATVDSPDAGGTIGLGVHHAKVSYASVSIHPLDEVPPDHPEVASGCVWSVLVNQSGFNLGMPKRFTAPHAADGDPFIIEDTSGEIRYEGTVQGQVGDFSDFEPTDTGPFVITVDPVGSSAPFGIGANLIERVAYENAVAFMSGSRCYYGDATVPNVGWNTLLCRLSVMWRGGDTYQFELPTLIDLFSANPSAFDDMRFEDEVYLGMAYELPPDTPEIVRLIAWGVDRMLAHDVNHTFWKEQLATFLAAYPDLAEWIPVEMYEDVRVYLYPLWSHPEHDRFTSAFDTPHTADLFQTYTQVGTGKGEFPPGHSIRPNLDMYQVALREERTDAEEYFEAAWRNVAWIVDNLDWGDPRTTKGQRQSEHVTVTALVDFLRRHPDRAPAGLRDKVEDWARVVVARSDNLWDFRKYSADRWTIPPFTGAGAADPNETGNIAGFAAPALAAASVVDDPALAGRLREIAVAAVDNIFGRNPVGRHASYRAATEQWGFEGVELGWYSEFQGGTGRLQGVRGVLEGSPKNAHYPHHAEVGNIGHSEGWISFNTAWNASLAWLADAETSVRVLDDAGQPVEQVVLGDVAGVQLTAPLNLDAAELDEAEVRVQIGDASPVPLTVRQDAPNVSTFSGELDAAALGAEVGDVVTVSYGSGSFTEQLSLTVVAPDACPDGHAPDTTVTFGDVDSGVPNYDRGDGCTFLDVVAEQGPFTSHGDLVRTVWALAEQWRVDGLFTRRESQDVVAAAARSGSA